ncbi:MAG: alanyl-tRNA editing protein, partial [Anaerovorax sp.]
MTEKLFQKDVYKRTCTAKVLEIQPEGKNCLLLLDRTLFFPTGGGQPCDLGTIDQLKVLEVWEKEGRVYHEISAQPTAFSVGQRVNLSLDWDRRFYHMQRHCGEHILSGIFFRELGAINQGFHMGETYMTIDMSVPDITWEQAMAVEKYANQVIWENAPTITRHFDKREDAEKLPLRKPLALDEDITI